MLVVIAFSKIVTLKGFTAEAAFVIGNPKP
jgi:hypothetical protein